MAGKSHQEEAQTSLGHETCANGHARQEKILFLHRGETLLSLPENLLSSTLYFSHSGMETVVYLNAKHTVGKSAEDFSSGEAHYG